MKEYMRWDEKETAEKIDGCGRYLLCAKPTKDHLRLFLDFLLINFSEF